MSEQPSEVQFLTPEDLARRWQISIGTISNWRTKKAGPEFIRIGGLVRYNLEAVTAWEASQPTK
jgi:predicted DNA-binding transcriptional regulator AlpA